MLHFRVERKRLARHAGTDLRGIGGGDEGRRLGPADARDPVRARRRARRVGAWGAAVRARRRPAHPRRRHRQGARCVRARGNAHRAAARGLARKGLARERDADRSHLQPGGRADHRRVDRTRAGARGDGAARARLLARGPDDDEAARAQRAGAGLRQPARACARVARASGLG